MLAKCKQNLKPCGSKCKPRKSLWRLAKRSGLLTLLMGLAACQTTTPSGVIEGPLEGASFCQAARAIYYSRHDTAPTIAQIKEHNAVGVALKCGWLPAKRKSEKP
jgi:hypothetical protein